MLISNVYLNPAWTLWVRKPAPSNHILQYCKALTSIDCLDLRNCLKKYMIHSNFNSIVKLLFNKKCTQFPGKYLQTKFVQFATFLMCGWKYVICQSSHSGFELTLFSCGKATTKKTKIILNTKFLGMLISVRSLI